MILAADKIQNTTESALRIMGIDLGVFVIICIVVILFAAILLYYIYDAQMRKRYMNDINNVDKEGKAHPKVLCEFTDDVGGPVERVLCESWKGEARKVELKSRGTFMMVNLFAKPPEDHSIDAYYLLAEHNYLDYYPYGKPKRQQILVQKFYFTKNDPCPKIPHDPSKWDAERYTKVTSAIARLAREESSLQVLVSEAYGAFEPIKNMIKFMQMLPLMRILQFATLGGLLALMVMGYSQCSNISNIAKFLIGK